MFLKSASIFGSLVVLIALVITLLKVVIGFVGFLAFAIKILILLAFLGVFASVGIMLYKTWKDKKSNS
jgi:hypothetical protein